MRVVTRELRFQTEGEIDLVDITAEVERVVKESGIENGQVLVFVPGATGAIVTIEHESGLLEDFRRALKELIPKGKGYLHDRIDDNAHSHLRATLLGASECFPVVDGRLVRGTWQQIFFVELDVIPRHRRVIVQVVGE
ncbi:secondary thiamine-phosphate synthase enzyme YjbQ [Thermococcus sp. MV11]|uniref:secondary thiamine-phosphate synthase enzyme YjbQ n=1 Tax=Thermococcus sp. MV11 TaxID=1638267 RepID=UPI0014304B0B|nr:secondary thiamine-phosphate synthase enzyme YjbQ [Thermococcus sp. MV11]NJE03985.1 YjbQ family protein [Thermococcus sp. MV11]